VIHKGNWESQANHQQIAGTRKRKTRCSSCRGSSPRVPDLRYIIMGPKRILRKRLVTLLANLAQYGVQKFAPHSLLRCPAVPDSRVITHSDLDLSALRFCASGCGSAPCAGRRAVQGLREGVCRGATGNLSQTGNLTRICFPDSRSSGDLPQVSGATGSLHLLQRPGANVVPERLRVANT